MSVVIRREGKNEFWTGDAWTGFHEDAIEYTSSFANAIIKKRWSKGIKEWKLCGTRYEPIIVGQAIAVDPKRLRRTRR